MNRCEILGDKGQNPLVICVVIHWGKIEDTVRCVNTLLMQTGVNYQVRVLDNGTADDVATVFQNIPVQVERLSVNTGFTGGVNRAMAYARESGVELCWILNNDVELEQEDCLMRLVAFAADSPGMVVSPTLRNLSNGQCRESGWSLFIPSLALTLADDGGRLPALVKRFFSYHAYVSGTAWLVRVPTAPVPLLDDSFFAYYEDVDLALRVGRDCFAVSPGVKVAHHVSGSTGGNLVKFHYKATNLVYLSYKHGMVCFWFRFCYVFVFVLSEFRKYWRTPLSFVRIACMAWRDGVAKTVVDKTSDSRYNCST